MGAFGPAGINLCREAYGREDGSGNTELCGEVSQCVNRNVTLCTRTLA